MVSPGFAVRPRRLHAGVARLRGLGFRVRVGPHVLCRNGYLAGSDEQRGADLASMLRDPEVRAVWFARGGYGTARLLERVPWSALRRDPKLLIGYSDVTALFAGVLGRSAAVCLYGPVVTELGEDAAWHAPSLRALVAGRPSALRLRRRDVLVHGRARGRLLGGNLSVLAHLCGTRYQPDCRDAVLLLEDVGEETYRIDRMLTQLRQAGVLRGLRAVLLGQLRTPRRKRFPPDRELEEVLREALLPLDVPVVRDLPVGHVARKRTLPLGAVAEIDTARGLVRFTP